ncbi:MAG: hypothetical protein JKY50_22755 [Oleispira sp.]|nr:hypothetical protein [Oleispira sp.]
MSYPSAGGGGASFAIGPIPNEFRSATRTGALALLTAQSIADPSWLSNYDSAPLGGDDNAPLNVRVFYTANNINYMDLMARDNGSWTVNQSFDGVVGPDGPIGPEGDGNVSSFPSVARMNEYFLGHDKFKEIAAEDNATVTIDGVVFQFRWEGASNPQSYDPDLWVRAEIGTTAGSLIMGPSSIESAAESLMYKSATGITYFIVQSEFDETGSKVPVYYEVAPEIIFDLALVKDDVLPVPIKSEAVMEFQSISDAFICIPAEEGVLTYNTWIGTEASHADQPILSESLVITAEMVGVETKLGIQNPVIINTGESVYSETDGVSLMGGLQTDGPMSGQVAPFIKLHLQQITPRNIALEGTDSGITGATLTANNGALDAAYEDGSDSTQLIQAVSAGTVLNRPEYTTSTADAGTVETSPIGAGNEFPSYEKSFFTLTETTEIGSIKFTMFPDTVDHGLLVYIVDSIGITLQRISTTVTVADQASEFQLLMPVGFVLNPGTYNFQTNLRTLGDTEPQFAYDSTGRDVTIAVALANDLGIDSGGSGGGGGGLQGATVEVDSDSDILDVTYDGTGTESQLIQSITESDGSQSRPKIVTIDGPDTETIYDSTNFTANKLQNILNYYTFPSFTEGDKVTSVVIKGGGGTFTDVTAYLSTTTSIDDVFAQTAPLTLTSTMDFTIQMPILAPVAAPDGSTPYVLFRNTAGSTQQAGGSIALNRLYLALDIEIDNIVTREIAYLSDLELTGNDKVGISSSDTSPGFLSDKISSGSNISMGIEDPGGDEKLIINATGGALDGADINVEGDRLDVTYDESGTNTQLIQSVYDANGIALRPEYRSKVVVIEDQNGTGPDLSKSAVGGTGEWEFTPTENVVLDSCVIYPSDPTDDYFNLTVTITEKGKILTFTQIMATPEEWASWVDKEPVTITSISQSPFGAIPVLKAGVTYVVGTSAPAFCYYPTPYTGGDLLWYVELYGVKEGTDSVHQIALVEDLVSPIIEQLGGEVLGFQGEDGDRYALPQYDIDIEGVLTSDPFFFKGTGSGVSSDTIGTNLSDLEYKFFGYEFLATQTRDYSAIKMWFAEIGGIVLRIRDVSSALVASTDYIDVATGDLGAPQVFPTRNTFSIVAGQMYTVSVQFNTGSNNAMVNGGVGEQPDTRDTPYLDLLYFTEGAFEKTTLVTVPALQASTIPFIRINETHSDTPTANNREIMSKTFLDAGTYKIEIGATIRCSVSAGRRYVELNVVEQAVVKFSCAGGVQAWTVGADYYDCISGVYYLDTAGGKQVSVKMNVSAATDTWTNDAYVYVTKLS